MPDWYRWARRWGAVIIGFDVYLLRSIPFFELEGRGREHPGFWMPPAGLVILSLCREASARSPSAAQRSESKGSRDVHVFPANAAPGGCCRTCFEAELTCPPRWSRRPDSTAHPPATVRRRCPAQSP